MSATEPRRRLDDLIHAWSVIVEDKLETESSLLAFGTRGGERVVLKVAKRHGDEWHSGEVLEAFRGNGVVRVHEHIEGAVLLERAAPGDSLVSMSVSGRDDEATAILAEVIERMSTFTPPERCATVHDWSKGFERYAATGDDRVPRDLVEAGHRCYVRLAASQRETRLLHGDLQHYNVLHDTHRGWLAIDPKGVIGEVEYEVGAALRNPVERPDLFASSAVVERRVQLFAHRLKLNIERALAWGFAQAVLSAIWDAEDGLTVEVTNPAIRLATAMRQFIDA